MRGLHITDPAIHLLFGLVLGNAISLLDFADKLGAATLDDREIVVGELAPLLLGFAGELLPIAFDSIPVHGSWLLSLNAPLGGSLVKRTDARVCGASAPQVEKERARLWRGSVRGGARVEGLDRTR